MISELLAYSISSSRPAAHQRRRLPHNFVVSRYGNPALTSLTNPPKGFLRLLARLPILLYRWNLGGLLGHRFLQLTHLGRKSGKIRKVVLEVLRHEQGVYIVASGWGERADWYKNLLASPQAAIRVADLDLEVEAQFLSLEESERELELYARRHPIASRILLRLFRTDPNHQWADLVRQFRLVRLIPVGGRPSG